MEHLNVTQHNEVLASQQQLAEMRTLNESVQKGQENISFPAVNAVAQQPMMVTNPMQMQQWQQPLTNLTNLPP
eukprot:10939565-Ditylum_brightwellii.AAC.2